ncbi:monoacylglycerol lipase abhd6-B-like [Antennarius striatus]|uniref:monoacylglycerol lipase abhd6-B-like n=1 Tax=Antennarius striatus TaxID=241820 RepID=UPI0035B09B07
MELIMLLAVIPVFALTTSFLFRPGALLKAYNWYLRCRLGLVVRYSHSGSYRFCYCSRGTPGGATPSVLLLHGFSSNKDTWLPLLEYLPRGQHVVCVDMPGHGGTSRTGPEDYSIEGQAHRIHQFVQTIGLDKKPFHLAGGSMGGNVTGVYAARYPNYVSSISLICPGGLIYPTETNFIRQIREVFNNPEKPHPMIPTDIQGLENMLKLCRHNPPKYPRQVLRGLLDNSIHNNDLYNEVFMKIFDEKSRHSLQDNMHLITAPGQIIWGKEDQVVDVSGAAVLRKALPNSQVALLDDCGHTTHHDQPRKVAKLIMDFISALDVNTGNAKKTE